MSHGSVDASSTLTAAVAVIVGLLAWSCASSNPVGSGADGEGVTSSAEVGEAEVQPPDVPRGTEVPSEPSDRGIENGMEDRPDTAPPEWPFPPDCQALDGTTFRVRGSVHPVTPLSHDLSGGVVRVLEDPSRTATTSSSGQFEITGVPACTVLTLVLDHPALHPVQTGTLFLGNEDLDNVTIQTPDPATYEFFVLAAQVEPDPGSCQIATTVTKGENAGLGPCYACGEPGVTVEIWPPVASSPLYFELDPSGIIYPLSSLEATTEDGGVLFANVPPGEYVLIAHKAGCVFSPARVTCRPGWFVNASPPYGIQGQGPCAPRASTSGSSPSGD